MNNNFSLLTVTAARLILARVVGISVFCLKKSRGFFEITQYNCFSQGSFKDVATAYYQIFTSSVMRIFTC